MANDRTTTPPGLHRGEFRRIAAGGFGDRHNAYPHAMAWYDDHLFVGTTRCNLALMAKSTNVLKGLTILPVRPAPNDPYLDFDIRSQIWRYHPPTDKWENIFTSPMMPPDEKGQSVPFFHGVRNMIVYQRRGEFRPSLYIMTWSHPRGPGPLLLRTQDGVTIEQHKFLGFEAEKYSSFRPSAEFHGRLYTAPSGRQGDPNTAGAVVVLETDDPLSDPWRQVNETNFGNPRNKSTAEMAVFNDHLYVGMQNPDGFEVWKTRAEGKPPYPWTQVLRRGAYRGPTNETAATLVVFNGCLYIGSTITHGGYDARFGIGPNACEVLRVYPDDTWDLLVGDGRLTEEGLRMPLSGLGPGFDKPFNTYLWRMCVHDGWLYAGTYSLTAMLPYMGRKRWPENRRKNPDPLRMAAMQRQIGGFDLWRTRDGVFWFPITQNGFGNLFNYGVRTLVSSPYGLFVGAANPFGPEVAVQRASGWRYEINLHGGLEIWMGTHGDQVSTADRPDSIEAPVISRGAEPVPPEADPPLEETVPAATGRFTRLRHEAPARQARSAPSDGQLDRPAMRIPAPATTPAEALVAEFYRGTRWRSFGAWNDGTVDASSACENLMEEVLSYLPEQRGSILDLGCGTGATAQYLLRYYPADRITAAPFERSEADALRSNLSLAGMTIVPARSPRLDLPGTSMDAVLNIETLGRNDRAVEWLRAVRRLLKPGGMFLGSAVLSAGESSPWRPGRRAASARTAAEFEALLSGEGFGSCRVADATGPCWQTFRLEVARFLWEKALLNEVNDDLIEDFKACVFGAYEPVTAYVWFCAVKA